MLKILRQIENISACRDREILAASVIAGIRESFPARTVSLLGTNTQRSGEGELIARADENGLTINSGEADSVRLQVSIPAALSDAFARGTPACIPHGNGALCGLPIESGAGDTTGVLLVELDQSLNDEQWEALKRFARFYVNYSRLLDDSEQDTLTQLLNRKTFDESFDRLLAEDRLIKTAEVTPDRRSSDEKHRPHWLAVADIDFFKKVNDTYGHLFGDEVLIRFSALMKKSFRKTDRLFRFGGEEFVILLRPSTEENIVRLLDRFRRTVESYEFPRVGHVTCSLGYASIDPQLAPTDILGQADSALYFSKESGRNQVNGFEALVAQGLLSMPSAALKQQPADIDHLFD